MLSAVRWDETRTAERGLLAGRGRSAGTAANHAGRHVANWVAALRLSSFAERVGHPGVHPHLGHVVSYGTFCVQTFGDHLCLLMGVQSLASINVE